MLVAGTCIGGGMLALPVVTGCAGFFPSLIMIVAAWGFMTVTALLLAEANLWMEEGAHIITIASRLLGPIGKALALILYLFMGYASLVSYASVGGDLLTLSTNKIFGLAVSNSWMIFAFVLICCTVIYLGNIIVGKINTILMVGLILSYLLIVVSGFSFVRLDYLLNFSWSRSFVSAPILLTTFSFQLIVPSLTMYLKNDGPALRKSIVIGTTLSLIIYLVWQWLALGILELEGANSLFTAFSEGKPVTEFLGISIKNNGLIAFGNFFAFFAIATSFLGIALGLFDFLSDGLKIKEKGWGNVALGFLVAIPVLFFALKLERVFLCALETSGGVGDSILNGIFPALMVWIGRYHKKMRSEYKVFGGRTLLIIIVIYFLSIFVMELLDKFNVVKFFCW